MTFMLDKNILEKNIKKQFILFFIFFSIIVAIILKNMKNNMNVHLYEKSYHKSHFLMEVSKKLNLNTKVFQKNIFEIKNLKTGTIMSRAFKPMPVVLELVYENFSKYKNIIFFMGKSGKTFEKDNLEII